MEGQRSAPSTGPAGVCARSRGRAGTRLKPGAGWREDKGQGKSTTGAERGRGLALLQEVASLRGVVLISHKIRKDPAALLCIQTLQKGN